MSQHWDEIKDVIEQIEYERLKKELSMQEIQERFIEKYSTLVGKKYDYLRILGEISVGLSMGIITIMFNYILFVWLLHFSF